jgi:hypothetical protein
MLRLALIIEKEREGGRREGGRERMRDSSG